MPGRVTDISNDFPVMGISIPLSLARKVQQKLGVGTLTLYKIIGHVKNPKDLTVLHDQYGHNVTFTTDADMLYTINQQLRVVRYALAGVNIIMRVVMISFLLFLTMSVMRNNQKVLHIFSLHGASRWQMFSIVWGEMMVYL